MKILRAKSLTTRRIILGLVGLVLFSAIAIFQDISSAQQLLVNGGSRTIPQSNLRIFRSADLEYASVSFDGVELFQIASQEATPSELEAGTSLSPIDRRVRRIEGILNNIIHIGFDPKTLDVRPATLNNLTVIVASDQKKLARQVLLTVTDVDAQINPLSVSELAEQWSDTIREALIKGWQERQPEARRQQILQFLGIVLGMMFLTVFLLWIQKKLKNHFNTLQKSSHEQPALDSQTSEQGGFFGGPLGVLNAFRQQANLRQKLTLNILLQRLDQIGLILLWFVGIAAIFYVFPETRSQGRGIIYIPISIFVIWFTLTLVTNLAVLYVNSKLQEWVEHAPIVSHDPQRRILRAPTLLGVLEGIIKFVALCIGVIWFLAWKGFFPTSLLTGAGLLGAALTFVFQNLLKDWINGILILSEDQYAVGDLIEFGGLLGIVEEMSLRATQIRTLDGGLTTIPHNQIITSHNLSKDWSRVNFRVEVAYNTDPNQAIALMKETIEKMAKDPQWQQDIIDPVSLIGVHRLTHAGIEIMMWIKVQRLRQLYVEQEFRRRLKLAFDEQGISIGIPQQNNYLSYNGTKNSD